jgi:hypothetical protein
MKQPFSMLACLDIVGRMIHWTDEDLNRFLRYLYIRKVDYLRFFLNCSWGPQGLSSQPHRKRVDGLFYFYGKDDKPVFNEVFFAQLKRLATFAPEWKVALAVDLNDHCATTPSLRDIHPYYHNAQGMNGLYDKSDFGIRVRNDVATKVLETIGLAGIRHDPLGIPHRIRPNILSLVNEGYCAYVDRHAFGEYWAYPLAHRLRQLGYKKKIMFSAHDDAAHAISAYVSSEGNWHTEFRKGDTINQLHGLHSVEWVRENVPNVEHGRWFGVSDDGTYDKNPIAKTWVECMKEILELCKEPFGKGKKKQRYLHHYEILPLSISEVDQVPWEIDIEDLSKFTQIRIQVFGDKSPLRKVPKWLNKRMGLA